MPRNSSRADEGFALRMKMAHRHSRLRDLNYTELSKLFGVSPSAVSTWFAGARVPYENITELARQFEVAADWLLTGREPMRPYPPSPLITLAQYLMMLDEETLSFLFFMVRLLQKKVMTARFLKDLVDRMMHSVRGLSMD